MSYQSPLVFFPGCQLMTGPLTGHHFANVFCKRQQSLPPHRLYDRSIDLLPGTTPPPPRGSVCPLPKTEAITTYNNNFNFLLHSNVLCRSSDASGQVTESQIIVDPNYLITAASI